jgi:hypothetical protein
MADKLHQILYYVFSFIKRILSKRFYQNLKKWNNLHNKYKGKRVFLIGNGPSLNQTPLYLLKDEYTMTFNHFDLMLERLNWNPDFYMLVDAVVAQDSKKEIELMVSKSKYSFFPDYHKTEHVDFSKFVPESEKVCYMVPVPWSFSTKLPFIGSRGSVIFEGFQVLAYLGFSEIYFLGVDMNYVIHTNTESIGNAIKSKEDDDPNHFDKRYFGKGRKYHQPNQRAIDVMYRGLKLIKENMDKLHIKSINIGYNSNVECFPKRDFLEVLGYNDNKIDELFGNLVRSKGFSSLQEFFLLAKRLNSAEEWDDSEYLQSMPVSLSQSVIKEKILTHLPLGPYKDYMFFVKREQLI